MQRSTSSIVNGPKYVMARITASLTLPKASETVTDVAVRLTI